MTRTESERAVSFIVRCLFAFLGCVIGNLAFGDEDALKVTAFEALLLTALVFTTCVWPRGVLDD